MFVYTVTNPLLLKQQITSASNPLTDTDKNIEKHLKVWIIKGVSFQYLQFAAL